MPGAAQKSVKRGGLRDKRLLCPIDHTYRDFRRYETQYQVQSVTLVRENKSGRCIILYSVFHARDNTPLFLTRQLKIWENMGENEIRGYHIQLAIFIAPFAL